MLSTQTVSAITPDLAGWHYHAALDSLHETLRPKTYFEIGTLHGDTLALARCRSLAVDPEFRLEKPELIARIMDKPSLTFVQSPSDDFFAHNDPERILGAKIDFAFLDGMHRCEFLLRDFINTERHCKRNSIIALHDCLPVEPIIAERVPSSAPCLMPHRQGWWTGDVWRTALLLKRRRPDLSITALDASPTGLLLVTNLDPASTALHDDYQNCVRTMLGWSLDEIGIDPLFGELDIQSTESVMTHERMTRLFWL